ncbi:hypothetical protein V6R21_30015 [Limibacter armeniacum]|uniref:hypothetical protein n=1 Tax=Limibacter armeniacum TaxID=466084 RepID=UPI002FE5D819
METSLTQLLAQRHTKEEMISFLKLYQDQFVDAIKVAVTDEQPLAWRATWLIGHCMNTNDSRVEPFKDKIIDTIPFRPDGHQRELLKLLQKIDLNEEQETKLLDICIAIWEKVGKSASVRITAFKFIATIAQKYPELKNEIEFMTQSHYTDPLSAGIKRQFEKLVKANVPN